MGMKTAGLAPLWGIDNDPAALAAYRANIGPDGILARVQDVDPITLAVPDVLWASPPCIMFSAARSKTLNSDGTEDLGLSVIPYLEALRPRVFLLENVPPYVRSSAFRTITEAISRLGYMYDWSTIDSSHHGVAQSRNRLILRASRDGLLPPLPARRPVIGWYAAIEDLLDRLPDSAFAPWQLQRLAAHPVYGPILMDSKNTGQEWGKGYRDCDDPAFTVVTDAKPSHAPRAFLMSNAATEWGEGLREPEPPAHAVTTQTAGRARAFLVSTQSLGRPEGEQSGVVVRDEAEPSVTIATNANRMRAFLIHPTSVERFPVRTDGEPSYTITGTHGMPRAFLVDCTTGDRLDEQGQRMLTIRDETDPAFTVTAGANRTTIRAGLPGRVVSLTPRALARFQSVPDSYILPEKRKDALKIIGNGVPCKVAQMLVEQFMESA